MGSPLRTLRIFGITRKKLVTIDIVTHIVTVSVVDMLGEVVGPSEKARNTEMTTVTRPLNKAARKISSFSLKADGNWREI
jgi:hypothetical protein